MLTNQNGLNSQRETVSVGPACPSTDPSTLAIAKECVVI